MYTLVIHSNGQGKFPDDLGKELIGTYVHMDDYGRVKVVDVKVAEDGESIEITLDPAEIAL